MGKVRVKINRAAEKAIGDMAIKAIKERNGNRCARCGRACDIDLSKLGKNQLPLCADCAAKLTGSSE